MRLACYHRKKGQMPVAVPSRVLQMQWQNNGGNMKTYEVCIQFGYGEAYIEVDADSPEMAEDRALEELMWKITNNAVTGYVNEVE